MSFLRTGIVLLALSAVASADVVLVNPGTDDRLLTITGLTIEGTTYDVTFTHGTSFDGLGAGAITFTSQGQASAVLNAIIAEVDGTAHTLNAATATIMVPYAETGGNTRVSVRQSSNDVGTSPYDFGSLSGGSLAQNEMQGASVAFATFAVAAVPEPSAFICVGLVGLVVAGRRWFSKRSA